MRFDIEGFLPNLPWDGPPIPRGLILGHNYLTNSLVPVATKIGKPVRVIEEPRPATVPRVEPKVIPTPEKVPVGVY